MTKQNGLSNKFTYTLPIYGSDGDLRVAKARMWFFGSGKYGDKSCYGVGGFECI